MALFVGEVGVKYHTSVDHHQPARNVSDKWWPTKLRKEWEIQEITKGKVAIAEVGEGGKVEDTMDCRIPVSRDE